MLLRCWVVGAVALALAGCTASNPAQEQPRREHDPAGTLVHLFEWPWADVAAECTAKLGPAGVAGVQISPPQAHISLPDKGFPWWQDYQPVSYELSSRRGDRAALARMVEQCHAAGVKIYADAVINHMAAGRFEFPGLYTSADFHHCGHDIADYSDRVEVQTCSLSGLADLATERPEVRSKIAAYLNDLLSLGIDGFRIDAAKHIPAEDLKAILAQLTRPAVVYSEVLYKGGEPITADEYRGFGATLEPHYGDKVSRYFRNASLVLLDDLLDDLLPSPGSVVYVDSHDTQRSGALSYRDGVAHTLATQFMLAYPYGTPLVMSSFAYETFDAGPPSDASGKTLPVSCGSGSSGSPSSGFVCEHREVLALVAWRKAMGDAPVEHWFSSEDQVGFARKGLGYFALNRSPAPVTRTVQTGLPAGRYADMLSSTTVEVDTQGQATITIPATGAVALQKER